MAKKDCWDKIDAVSNIIAAVLIFSATVIGFYMVHEPLRKLAEKRDTREEKKLILDEIISLNSLSPDRAKDFFDRLSDEEIKKIIQYINREAKDVYEAKQQVSRYAKESKAADRINEGFVHY